MKITFFGTGHGRAEPDRFHSSALVSVGHRHYMIDAGAPVSTLYIREGRTYEDLKGVFITHSHMDHCLGLVGMADQIRTKHPGIDLPVYVPDRTFCDPLVVFLAETKKLKQSNSPKGKVDFRVYGEGEIFNDGVVRVVAVPVAHYPNAHAFILEAERKRICFTGDMKGDLSDYPKQILEQDFDLVVCEAAHNHLDDPKTIHIISRSRTKRLFINHIKESRNTPQAVSMLRQAVKDKFPVTVASDGMTVDI